MGTAGSQGLEALSGGDEREIEGGESRLIRHGARGDTRNFREVAVQITPQQSNRDQTTRPAAGGVTEAHVLAEGSVGSGNRGAQAIIFVHREPGITETGSGTSTLSESKEKTKPL